MADVRPAGYPLLKYEGLGNDFLVLVDPEGAWPISAELAIAACDRHLGWGADGLLRAGPAEAGSALSFELRNADGSQAEMSGNGLRCLVHAAIEEGAVDVAPGACVEVLTPVGPRRAWAHQWRPGWLWATTEMGAPVVTAEGGRGNIGHGQAFVDVGNPHLVVLGPDPRGVDVAALGPSLSAGAGAGDGGVNVEFVTLGPGADELTLRVWERGVGETTACGTGAVAAAAALHHWGRVGRKVTVHQPGGAVEVELRADGVAVLTGPSRRVGRCWLELGRRPGQARPGASSGLP